MKSTEMSIESAATEVGDDVASDTELIYPPTKVSKCRKQLELNILQELKKRWLVFGIMFVVLLAVLAPNVGAPGGSLHTGYWSPAPLSFIYFSTGRRTRAPRPSSQAAAALLQARLLAPAAAAAVVAASAGMTDYRVASGLLMSSMSPGCAWLSLALLSRDRRALSQCVAASCGNYVAALLTAPVAVGFVCGQFILPPLGSILSTIISTTAPFALGAASNKVRQRQTIPHDSTLVEICALSLVYIECCKHLQEAAGSLFVTEVLGTFFLVVVWLVVCCASCHVVALYCGDHDHTVLATALPRSIDEGWHSTMACSISGL